jgi:NADPH:quinone reductase-like Zn-dependent oxidoreductase
MRAVVISEHGDADVLKVEDRPAPQLYPSEVRIDVRAAGVNFADIMSRLGQYSFSPRAPCIGGYEVCGVVTEVGAEVTTTSVGDRVAGITRRGGYAEETCVHHGDAVRLPESVSFTEGAAIPLAYVTAHAGLIRYGGVRAGERVLVHAAAGGVGIAATQLAKHAGAEVVGTASPTKHEAILGFGVDQALDYTKPGWANDLAPFDLVMDAIGGDSFKHSYDLLRPGGRLVAFGAVSTFGEGKRDARRSESESDFRVVSGVDASNVFIDSRALIGLDIRVLWEDRRTLEEWLAPLGPLIADGVIAPVVSDVVSFDDAPEAHRILSERRNIGKVVLVP